MVQQFCLCIFILRLVHASQKSFPQKKSVTPFVMVEASISTVKLCFVTHPSRWTVPHLKTDLSSAGCDRIVIRQPEREEENHWVTTKPGRVSSGCSRLLCCKGIRPRGDFLIRLTRTGSLVHWALLSIRVPCKVRRTFQLWFDDVAFYQWVIHHATYSSVASRTCPIQEPFTIFVCSFNSSNSSGCQQPKCPYQ